MTHDLKEGDYVEIVLRAKVEHLYRDVVNLHTLDGCLVCLSKAAVAQAKITKLEPELKVGRARHITYGVTGTVVHIENDEAWLRPDTGYGVGMVVPVHLLRNIPEDGQ